MQLHALARWMERREECALSPSVAAFSPGLSRRLICPQIERRSDALSWYGLFVFDLVRLLARCTFPVGVLVSYAVVVMIVVAGRSLPGMEAPIRREMMSVRPRARWGRLHARRQPADMHSVAGLRG